MRILVILLIAGLCLVTAKYIPQDVSDTNSALNRVKRSNSQDSDSDTASVERDDDSSKDNDNEDSEDNDSTEKRIKEERDKLREKEEKKKQKLLEKLEKEKQKEIEERRKREEKLEKAQQKEQEKKEKEERKLQERIEKERRKLEEEKRKMEKKLEKEEKKRQEKLKKQLDKLQKEQKESAEDTYLETEEEDSVEMEDIWKAHVYEKYGLNITSTKLERQSALQRYLQEEMGINANSTKSERRQAILKLIQTKLQNDSAAVDSFRNLLLSHVNAVQIQKLKSKLENNLEELNNQTVLLSNVTDPWVSEAKQNIEEKRTFIQAIAQFLSNIVPNWFTGGQNLPNQSSDAVLTVVTNVDGTESNLSVLPSSNTSVSSSSNPLESNGLVGSEPINSNVPFSPNNENAVNSNTGNTVNFDSSNTQVPASPTLSSNNPPELNNNGFGGSGPVSNNVPVSQTENSANSGPVNNLLVSANSTPSNSGNSVDVGSPNSSTPTDSGSGNPQEVIGSEGNIPVINNNAPSQTSVNGPPSSNANTVNTDMPNTPATTEVGSTLDASSKPNISVGSDPLSNNVPVTQTEINGIPSNVDESAIIGSPIVPISTNSGSAASNPSEENLSAGSISVNNSNGLSQTSVNGLPPSTVNTANPGLPNIPISSNSESTLGNPSKPSDSVPSDSLDNNVPMIQTGVSETPSNSGISVDVGSPSAQTSSDSGSSNNPSEVTGSAGSNSVNNNDAPNQTSVNGLPSSNGNTVNSDVLNTPATTDSGSTLGTSSEPSESVGNNSSSNNIPVIQTDINGTPSNVDESAIIGYVPISSDSGSAASNPPEGVLPAGSNSINNSDALSQTSVNGLPPNSVDTANPSLPSTPILSDSESTLGNSSKLNESVGSDFLNNNIPVIQTDISATTTNTVDLSNAATSTDSGLGSNNPAEASGSADSNSVNNNDALSQTSVNGLNPSNADTVSTANTANVQISNSALNSTNSEPILNSPTGQANVAYFLNGDSSLTSEQSPNNPPQLNESVISNVTSSQTNGSNVDGLLESNITSVQIDPIDENVNTSTSIGSIIDNTNGQNEADLSPVQPAALPISNGTVDENTNTPPELSENIPTETANEVANTNSNNASGVSPSIDDAVQVTDTLTVNTDNVSSVSDVNNVSSTNSLVNDSSLTVTTAGEPTTLNFETVTVVYATNNQEASQNPSSQDGIVSNVEVAGTESITTPVGETNDVTQAEAQTERGNVLEQEIVNTPSDLVTVASVQASSPSPPLDVIVPVEPDASVVDIKFQ